MADHAVTRLDGPVPGVPGAFVREVEALPEHLADGERIGPYTEGRPGALLFEVPRIARYLIRDGVLIEVAVAKDADRSAAELFLHTSGRGTLIHQRGEVPLNAVTLIAPNRKCVAICGPSGFGKSTLAAALSRCGWLLLADGVTRVTWNGAIVVAWPSDNKLKLWRDTCEAMKLDPVAFRRARHRMEEFYVPVPAATTPASLSAVVQLRLGRTAAIGAISPGGTFIADNSFRPHQLDPLGCRAAHTHVATQIARNCRTLRLEGARRSPISGLARQLSEAIR